MCAKAKKCEKKNPLVEASTTGHHNSLVRTPMFLYLALHQLLLKTRRQAFLFLYSFQGSTTWQLGLPFSHLSASHFKGNTRLDSFSFFLYHLLVPSCAFCSPCPWPCWLSLNKGNLKVLQFPTLIIKNVVKCKAPWTISGKRRYINVYKCKCKCGVNLKCSANFKYLLGTLRLFLKSVHSAISVNNSKYWSRSSRRQGWTFGAVLFASENSILLGVLFPGCYGSKGFSTDYLILDSF